MSHDFLAHERTAGWTLFAREDLYSPTRNITESRVYMHVLGMSCAVYLLFVSCFDNAFVGSSTCTVIHSEETVPVRHSPGFRFESEVMWILNSYELLGSFRPTLSRLGLRVNKIGSTCFHQPLQGDNVTCFQLPNKQSKAFYSITVQYSTSES